MARSFSLVMVLCLTGCPDDGDAGGSSGTAAGTAGAATISDATTMMGGNESPQTAPTNGQEGDSSGVNDSANTSGGASEDGCCERHAGGGCNEPDVEACVCKMDAVCCTFEWDEACVDIARNSCDATCEAVDEGVDDATDTVGDVMDTSGGGVMDTSGGGVMDTSGGGVMDTGGGGNCCDVAASPGCSDMATQTCVCNEDPFCCNQEWDNMCVSQAINGCGLDCGPIDTSCCAAHPSPGCDDMTVQDCVCALDRFCCNDEWDGQCVDEAANECLAGC